MAEESETCRFEVKQGGRVQTGLLRRRSLLSPTKDQELDVKFTKYVAAKVCDEEEGPKDRALRDTWSGWN